MSEWMRREEERRREEKRREEKMLMIRVVWLRHFEALFTDVWKKKIVHPIVVNQTIDVRRAKPVLQQTLESLSLPSAIEDVRSEATSKDDDDHGKHDAKDLASGESLIARSTAVRLARERGVLYSNRLDLRSV